MPITFGAVGDILSVCLLVKDLVNALDKVRGSKAEYQSLTRELWILDRVLLEVDLLARTHDGGRTPELNAFCQTAREAVDRCKTLVSDFLARLRKYQNSFEEGGSSSSNVFKTTAMKVRWRVGEKDAVEKFRVDIAATSASLQMLLTTATVNLLSIHVDKVDKRMSDIHKNNEAHHTKADATLASLLDRLEETNILFTFKNSMTSKIADALRLDWLHQLVSEWTSLLRRVIAMNIATYRAFLKIQSALSSCRERVLIEEPLTLEDAIGRITPIHLQFVRSWDAFNAVLEIRFRNMEGHTKVKKQQYKLQDKVTKRDILPGKSWDGVFFPGQRVEMSFIFDQDGNRTESTCPSCQASSISPLTEEIQCSNCHLWYRRVTIMQDTEEPPQRPSHPQWKSSEPAFGQTGLEGVILGPAKPGIKRASSSDPDGEDDISYFKRVRLIAKQHRPRFRAFGSDTTRQRYVSFAAVPGLTPGSFRGGSQRTESANLHSGRIEAADATMPHLDPATTVEKDLENARKALAEKRRRPPPNLFQNFKRILQSSHSSSPTSTQG